MVPTPLSRIKSNILCVCAFTHTNTWAKYKTIAAWKKNKTLSRYLYGLIKWVYIRKSGKMKEGGESYLHF